QPPAPLRPYHLDNQSQHQHQQQQQQQKQRHPFSRDFIDSMFTVVDKDLLFCKLFYFFFFGAFGSLFPLLAIYFKQLGMSAAQSGVLIGFRPFIEFLSAPFWGGLADKWRRGKEMLLFALLCWIVFTLAIAFVKPPAHKCLAFNGTHNILEETLSNRRRHSLVPRRFSRKVLSVQNAHLESNIHKEQGRFRRRPYKPDVSKIANVNSSDIRGLVFNMHSTVVYKQNEVNHAFFILLLLVVIGEFFSAPAITFADSVTLSFLGDDTQNYGRQRMFGSLGWGLAMFFVGMALDQSTTFPDGPCRQAHAREKNYTVCFAVFSVLMSCAFLAALQVITLGTTEKNDIQNNNHRCPPQKIWRGFGAVSGAIPFGSAEASYSDQPFFGKWLAVMKLLMTYQYISVLFISWFMGFGIGVIFTFLFWHLQDLGGSPTLFGVASVINHVSELLAYFLTGSLIVRYGHVKVLYAGLLGNVCRFMYISLLQNPWWVLPFEFVQGLTHAAVWAACCAYITHAIPVELRSSAQGILQGLHHGLGRGCGAVFGGVMVNQYGDVVTFRIYGVTCIIVLALYMGLNIFLE
ncbi:hypothetical protein EGW08_008474, partial [Elysia chlorotica]